MRKLIVALALLLAPIAAHAQFNPSMLGSTYTGWTTSGRIPCSTGTYGFGFNTTLGSIEWCSGSGWEQPLATSGGSVTGPISQSITWSALPPAGTVPYKLTLNSNFQTTPISQQSALWVNLNDNGDSSGNGTGTTNLASELIANVNSTDANSGNGTPNAAFDFGVEVACLKRNPSGGLPTGAALKNCYATWSPNHEYPNNEFASMNGVISEGEWDLFSNGLDDAGNRFMGEYILASQVGINGGSGWPLTATVGLLLSGEGTDVSDNLVSIGEWINLGPDISNAGIDLQQIQSVIPSITSSTPGGSVYSVTVNHVLPLSFGNINATNLGVGGGSDTSTAAHLKIASAAASGSTVTLADVNYLKSLMFVYDVTNPAAIANGTHVISIAGNVVTLTGNTSVADGDQLLFAPGRKSVSINGDFYTVAGVVVSAVGSDAGTVYFTSAVTAADAANGNSIVPNTHAIWFGNGGNAAPWNNIAFGLSGTTTIGGDGAGGLSFQTQLASMVLKQSSGLTISGALAGWSNANWGNELFVTTSVTGDNNPAIGISDTNGANLFGIADVAGQLNFAQMPAKTDNTDPPIVLLSLGSDVLVGNQATLAPSATAGFTHPFVATSGAPSGTPANVTTPPCVFNNSTGALNCYFSSSWHHLTFTAGAG